ncbi:hypothetical protein [Sulfuracidifex tepidarius]|nr:hypothetical protein [Sulfuracidifex tepidarius]
MEDSYSESMKIDIPRGLLIKIISDPFIFMSTTGHIIVLRKLDSGNYLIGTINDRVLNDKITEKSKTDLFIGELSPPNFTGSMLIYRGDTFDGKVIFEIVADLTSFSRDMSLNFSMKLKVDEGILGFFKNRLATAEHVIKSHVIPTFKKFSDLTKEASELTLIEPVDIPKYIVTKAKQTFNGIMMVYNPNIYALFKVENGTITRSVAKVGETSLNGNDVLFRLIQEREKLTVKTLDPLMLNVTSMVNELA